MSVGVFYTEQEVVTEYLRTIKTVYLKEIIAFQQELNQQYLSPKKYPLDEQQTSSKLLQERIILSLIANAGSGAVARVNLYVVAEGK